MSTSLVASLQVFVLILFRTLAVFMIAPAISVRAIPTQAKIGLAFFVTLVLWPLQQASLAAPLSVVALAGAALRESLVGALVGFVARLATSAAEMAGGIMDLQTGFRAGATLNPLTSAPSSALDQLYFLAATLLFLVIDGHHVLLLALTRTYETIPLASGVSFTGLASERLVSLVSVSITAGCSIALPVVAVTLILDVALAIVARAVPQVQVFFVGMPVKIGVALAFMAIVAPGAVRLLSLVIGDVPRQVDWLMGAL